MNDELKEFVEALLNMERHSSHPEVEARLNDTLTRLTKLQLFGVVGHAFKQGLLGKNLIERIQVVCGLPTQTHLGSDLTSHVIVDSSDFAKKHDLSRREEEVVDWTVWGLQNREIALLMGMSVNSVRNYLVSVFKKVGVTNRAELTHLATPMRSMEEPLLRTMPTSGPSPDRPATVEGGEVLELLFDPEEVDAETAARVIEALSCIYGGELEIESIKPAPPGKIETGRAGPSREMDAAIGP